MRSASLAPCPQCFSLKKWEGQEKGKKEKEKEKKKEKRKSTGDDREDELLVILWYRQSLSDITISPGADCISPHFR